MRPTVAAFYFPNWHVDPTNEKFHGKGWTEWELLKAARPRFAGHQQPKVPAWGYQDESDPQVMAQKIAAAAEHGVDVFLFDWYWHDEGPFLERGLEKGYLGAENNDQVKFACMWANHDWVDLFPAHLGKPKELHRRGAVTEETWEKITDHLVNNYFVHPSHWKIDGKPVFSVYELFRLVESFGGVEGCRRGLEKLRAKAVKAGLPGVHLNAIIWGVKILPSETAITNPAALLDALGFDSVTSYVVVHHVRLKEYPATDYAAAAREFAGMWDGMAKEFRQPYWPNVSMGWDASPRTDQAGGHENEGYPYMPMLTGNTPERFEEALRVAARWVAGQVKVGGAGRGEPLVTINAWNEWTEGSYLEPDVAHGMKYLEAIKRVFGVAGGA